MPFDLAISEHNDLVFQGNNDLGMVFGTDLIEQRIRLRLKMIRGQWIYDQAKTLGSDLRQILHEAQQNVGSKVEAMVRSALGPMKDIHVGAVEVFAGESEREIVIRVHYSQIPSPGVVTGVNAPIFQASVNLTFQP